MERRNFLGACLAGLGVAMLPRVARAATPPRLVFVLLRGGTDALSLFAPRGAAWTRLQQLRGTVAMTSPLAFTPDLYAHPALKPLLDAAPLGLVLHAGGAANTRSHFDQQYKIETGINGARATRGFLSRAADVLGLRTLAVDRTPPDSLLGGTPTVLHDPARVQPGFADGALKPRWSRGQRLGMYRGTDVNPAIDAAAARAQADYALLDDELAGVTLADLTARHGYDPASTFGGRLALAARLMASGRDPRLVTVDGDQFWDSHAKQNTNDAAAYVSLYKSISDLGKNLAAFTRDLMARGLWSSTVVVVMSEFGRTIAANSALGTDHGRGGVMMLLGGKVRPAGDTSFAGVPRWTLPATIDDSTPLAVTHDYRIALVELFARHLGMAQTDARAIFANEASGAFLDVLR